MIYINDIYHANPAPEPIFTQNTSNDMIPRKDVPFRGYKTKK